MLKTYHNPVSRLPIPYRDVWSDRIDQAHHPHDVVDDLQEPARDGVVHHDQTQHWYPCFWIMMGLNDRVRPNVTPSARKDDHDQPNHQHRRSISYQLPPQKKKKKKKRPTHYSVFSIPLEQHHQIPRRVHREVARRDPQIGFHHRTPRIVSPRESRRTWCPTQRREAHRASHPPHSHSQGRSSISRELMWSDFNHST